MLRMVIETFDSPFAVKRKVSYPHGGGHPSVRALQASILWPRRPSRQHPSFTPQPVKVEKVENGVQLQKFCDTLRQWFPYQRITLQEHTW